MSDNPPSDPTPSTGTDGASAVGSGGAGSDSSAATPGYVPPAPFASDAPSAGATGQAPAPSYPPSAPAYGSGAPSSATSAANDAPGYPGYAAPQGYSAPGYAAPGYPAPGYGAPAYGYAAPARTNVLAIISLVASITGLLFILPVIGPIAAVIMGHISLSQIKRTGEKGRGMALTGAILGWIGVGFIVLFLILLIVGLSIAASNDVRYGA